MPPLLVLGGLTMALAAPARPALDAVDPFHERWRWVRFTAADGLELQPVTHLVEVEDVPWAGGRGGLAWYDGWRWQSVAPPEGFPDEPLIGLEADPSGRVHAAFPSGLFAGGRQGFERVALDFLGPDRELCSIAVLGVDELLLLVLADPGTRKESVLYRWSQGRSERLELVTPGWQRFLSPRLMTTRSGRIWLNHGQGLQVWTGSGWSEPGRWSQRMVDVLAENQAGRGLLGLRYPFAVRGLWSWDAQDSPVREASEGHGVALAADVGPSGEALVVYDTSAVRFREHGSWRTIAPLPEALVQPTLVRFRSSGDLWAANERGLWLMRRSSQRWERFLHGGLNDPRDRIHALAFDREGCLWLGSAGGVERRHADGTPAAFVPMPDPIEVTGLAFDESAGLWLSGGGTFPGLLHWDGAAWSEHLVDEAGQELGLIHAIRADRRGRLWLLALTDSLAELMEERGSVHVLERGRVLPWEHGGELADRRLYDFAEAGDGSFWFASSRGVSRWDGSRWRHWGPDQGLRGTYVFRVVPTADGGAWIGQSQQGLARIEPDAGGAASSVRYVSLGSGPALKCLDLALDEGGDLWVTTGAGLFLVQDGIATSFGFVAGLEHLQVWPVIARSERVYVGTLGGGLAMLDRAEALHPAPRVVLEAPTERRGQAVARWTAHAWWGELPAVEVETRTRLDGGPWSSFSKARELVLETAAGTHALEVQAKGLFGALGEPARLELATAPPFHRREPFWIASGVLALALVVLGVLYVVRRRRDAAALAMREGDYRTLMEGASDAIFWCDQEGVCRGANPSACTLLGRRPEEVLGATLGSLLAREDGRPDLLAELEDGRAVAAVRGTRPDGQPFRAEASLKRVAGARVVAIVRDTSEREALEEHRRALERSLLHSQRLESLGLLAGGVAHDFNNLLMLVMGHAEQALARLRGNGEPRADLERVLEAARRAGELTQELLAFAGSEPIEPRPCDLNRVVRGLEELLRASLHPHAELALELAPGLPEVRGDPARIGQAILALVINAAESFPGPGGRVVLSTRFVPAAERAQLVLELDDLPPGCDLVAIAVQDEGCGLAPEVRARAFEPFFTTKPRARGLGLAAVAGIARSHQGGIHIATGPGRGSTFVLLFPAAGAAPPRAPLPELPAAGGLVLVIDDDDAVREVMAAMLARSGFRPLSAASGREGLELFRRHADELLCTIVDLTMPELSGLETRAALLALRPDAAVLLMSGYNEQLVREREWLKPQAFLRKPFTTQELEGRLRALAPGGPGRS